MEETKNNQDKSEDQLASEWEKLINESQNTDDQKEAITSQKEDQKNTDSKFKVFLDIPVEISVEIGSSKIPLEEVTKLHPGSVVELDRNINEYVDIKVNGRVIAKGELYTIDENYGVKIKQIITPEERLKLFEDEE